MKIITLSLLLILGSLFFPCAADADNSQESRKAPTIIRLDIQNLEENSESSPGILSRLRQFLGVRRPAPIKPEIGTVFTVQASAYASSPYQTNSQPCITAAGTRVRYGVVATNFLPMGTLLDINGEPFIVEDRMNARYRGYYIDIWFPSTSEALQFGRKNLKITIKGYGKPGQPLMTPQPSEEKVLEDKTDEETEEEQESEQQESEQQEDDDIEIFIEEPESTWDIFRGWTSLMTFTLAQLLSIRVNQDVNRFDVDCFN